MGGRTKSGRATGGGAAVKPLQTLPGEKPLYSLVASHDGKKLLAGLGLRSDNVKLWDLATASVTQVYSGHKSPVYSCALSADGDRVVSGAKCGRLCLHDP